MTGIPAPSGAASGFGLALQTDGKIVMAGSSGSGSASGFGVARFNSNGTLDTSFNGSGTNATQFGTGDDHANGVAIQSDGKIVAAGSSFSSFVYTFALTRYNADGTADTGFGNKTATIGTTYNEAFAVTVDGAGKILMAGKAGDSAATDFAVLRYTSAGTLDSTFNGTGKVRTQYPTACSGGGCIGQAQAIAIQPDGKIVVAGWSGPLGNSEFMIVRYNTNGTLDSTFGTNGIKVHSLSGGNDSAYAVKIVGSNILVAGTINATGSKASYALVRYTSSGAVDTSFGTNGVVVTSVSGGNDVASSIAIADDGKIIIGGDANDLSGDFAVARYSANGVLDNTFGCNTPGSCAGIAVTNLAGTDQGKTVAIQPDGNIVLGGAAGAGTASAKFAVARYIGSGSVGGGNGPTQLAVTAVNSGNPVGAGVGFAVDVQSRNAAGAPTSVTAATQVSLALTTGTGPLNGTAACTIATGSDSCTVSGLTLTTVQSNAVITASAVSGNAMNPGASAQFSVVAGPAANFLVSGYPASSGAGSSNAFTVRARDAYNNTAVGYTGTVHFASSDAAAALPANYTFTGGDAGIHQFTGSLRTVGTWTLTATDTVTGSVSGTQTGLTVTVGAPAILSVVSGGGQNASVNVNFGSPLLVNLKDGYGNNVAGQTITFAAPASGAGATFIGGGTTTVADTDASGNANSNTVKANLAGGSYNVTASLGALTPASFPLTNNKVNSTTTLARTSGTSPAAVNSSLTFTATVSGGTGTPTGSVNFLVDGLPLCSGVALNASAQAACTTQALTAGNRSLSAQYQGNGTYNSSASSALAQTMSKNTPTLTITGTSPNPSSVNAAVTVNFTVTPSPAGPLSPTGNVTVSDGTLTCTGTVAAGQCSITFTSAGQKTLTASYTGDGNFNTATSAAFSHNVSSVGATVVMSANPTTVTKGGTSTITATVTGGQGTPTGSVAVTGAGGSCPITLSSGTGTCILTANDVGTNQLITGSYGGNGTYGGSSGTTQLTVNKATPTVNLTNSPTTINLGSTTTVSVTVTSLAGTPTGTVSVSGAGGSCTITLGGTNNCVLTPTSSGPNQTITGIYNGDSNFNSASDTTTVTVNVSSATVTLSASPTTVTVGGTSTISATVTGAQGTPTGTVAVSGAGGSCTITLGGTNNCVLTTSIAGSGQVITGNYSGNATYAPASGTTTLTVNKATPTISIGANPVTITLGQPTTVTATVTGGAGTPTGTVSVTGAGASCTITLGGVNNCVLTPTGAGSNQTITGNYSGDAKYNAGSGTTSLTVNKATPTVTLSASPPTVGLGGTSTITATVTSSAGTPTGTVAVTGAGGSCTITLPGSCVLTAGTIGSNQTITGSYSGNANFNAASGTTTLNVANVVATVALSASPTTVFVGSSSSITATVSGNQGTPTGTVSVSGAGGNCTITLAGGTGSCNLATGIVGSNQTITGTYSGNATYGSNSGTTTLTVRKVNPSVNVSTTPNVTYVNEPVMASATVSGTVGTPTGSVSITGAGGTCTISLNNGSGTCMLTPTVTGNGQLVSGPYSGDANYMPVTATTSINVHGSASGPILDVDLSGAIEPSTDGLLVQRYLFGFTGDSLVGGALSGTAQRLNPADIIAYLDSIRTQLDVDGDTQSNAMTDGMLIIRYLKGMRGTDLVQGVVGVNATRNAQQIQDYIATLLQ